MNIPLLQKKAVYHVGTLNPKDIYQHGASGGESLEGHQLSVSEHPEIWRKIARLGDLPTFLLSHPQRNLRLLDIHRLNTSQKQAILIWGLEEGLITPAFVYLCWNRDEEGKLYHLTTNSLEEAKDEQSEVLEENIEHPIITKSLIWKATTKLTQQIGKSSDPDAFDLLCAAFARKRQLDGVWWEECLAPLNLSAPRGLLLTEHLPLLNKKPLQTSQRTG